jgi:carbon monoxide dehydrogenase subunit G
VNLQGERSFAAPRATVWRVLNDPASMAKTMPGVESFDVHDDRRWTANVKIPLGLGGLKMKIDMEKTEEREPDFAKLAIKGQGVGAMLNMQTSFDLSDGAEGGTAMKWSADVRIAGPVGSMGQRVLQPIVNQQVQHVLTALDEQVREALAPTGATGAGDAAGGATGTSPAPSTEAAAPAAQGPLDYGPPAEATPEPEPESGSSAAEQGVSPWSPEQFEREPEGPTASTQD